MAVGLDRPGQRALLALRPQVEVDVPDALCGRRTGDEAAHVHRQPHRLLEVGGRRPLVDEHHVEVAGVRQLGATEAPEGDDGERQRRLERRRGRPPGWPRRSPSRPRRRRRRCRRAAHRAAITPNRWRSFHRRSARWRSSSSARQPSASVADSTRSARSRVASRDGSGSRATRSGLRCSDVGGQPGRADQVAQLARRLRRLAEGAGDLGRPARVAAQVAHVEQPEVRIGALRQPPEQERQDLLHQPRRAGEATGQLAYRRPRAQPVGEPERAQPRLDGAGAAEQLLVPGRRTPRATDGSRAARGSPAPCPGGGPARRRAARRRWPPAASRRPSERASRRRSSSATGMA